MSDTGERPERPQVWHEYRMNHAINVAWLGWSVSTAQMYALEDAWDSLVVNEEWRDWHQAHLRGSSAFLYLAVRDGLPARRLRKTRNGASLQLPASELVEAERDGTLIPVFRGVIRDLYARWAEGHGVPAPPELPASE